MVGLRRARHGVPKPFIFSALALSLCGCTAIPLSDIKPVISSLNGSCSLANDVRGDASPGSPAKFHFLLPQGGKSSSAADEAPQTTASFKDYADKTIALSDALPSGVQDTAVARAIMRMMIKTSAQAQVEAGKAAKLPGSADFDKEIDAYPVPAKLTHGDLKVFTKLLVDEALKPKLHDAAGFDAASKTNPFALYFTAYYENKFVDRFGQSYQKPQLAGALQSVPVTITIPDADIASALSVLLEYAIDLFDNTPVFGDAAHAVDAKTFYPANSSAKPTALTANLAKYQQISSGKCGITPEGAKLMADVANAAGDQASAVSGLVSQSFGGVGVSLGVFGKISFGDNQTLATVVKTAASRVATRAAYTASYWALRNIKNPSNPAADVSGRIPVDSHSTYLNFWP